VRIAVDAMGGDRGPAAVLAGAADALRQERDVELLLVGDPEVIRSHWPSDLPLPEVEASEGVVRGDEAPVAALRDKPRASLPLTVHLLADGRADAMVSAGSTGVMMAGALLELGLLPGVMRPALATPLVSPLGTQTLLLDVGAHMDARPDVLVQYAYMGSLYAQNVRHIDRPRVGLLNVGTEPGKGNRLVRAAHKLLEGSPLHFVGNVEARDVYRDKADVLVCDGFAGNLVLKSLEGLGLVIRDALRAELTRDLRSKLGAALSAPALRRLARSLDYAETGGAPLFGTRKPVIKCHGASGPKAIRNGIAVAATTVRTRVLERMAEAMARLPARTGEA
jgi:glycerol-3-phosphate acyltransferase PlsX